VGADFFYPDVMVVCEDKTDNPYYTESPILLVEVLSKSTRRIDETIKRVAYSSFRLPPFFGDMFCEEVLY